MDSHRGFAMAKGEGRRGRTSLKGVTGEQVDAWPFTCKHADMDCRRVEQVR